MMFIHHMSITANLTIYLAFPGQKVAHRVVDHTWFDQVACWPIRSLDTRQLTASRAASWHPSRLGRFSCPDRRAAGPGE